MAPQPRIDNLNELFRRLFRGEEGDPIIGGWPRLSREDYFRMFFPEELCSEYLAKTKANLTWFFRDDPRNKAIRRSLIRMLEQDLPHVLGQTHRKCAAVLWPQSQHAAFRSRELWDVLSQLRLPPVLNRKYGIVPLPSGQAGAGSRLREFYDADPAAALARVILTLAIATDAPESMIGRLWDSIPESPEDTSVPGMIRRGNLLYLSGRHSEAFPVLEDAARLLGRPAQTPEEAALYCRLGRMLATGDGHYTDLTAARKYLELGAAGAVPRPSTCCPNTPRVPGPRMPWNRRQRWRIPALFGSWETPASTESAVPGTSDGPRSCSAGAQALPTKTVPTVRTCSAESAKAKGICRRP